MPIHSIPFEADAHAPMVWYEHSGLVSFRGRLYFVPPFAMEEERLSLVVAENLKIVHQPRTDGTHLWPNPDFFINIQYGVCLIIEIKVVFPLSILMCQERWNGALRYQDQANPAVIRLQRWMRRTVRRPRQLAAAMALHPRLGSGSGLAGLGTDLVDAVLSLV